MLRPEPSDVPPSDGLPSVVPLCLLLLPLLTAGCVGPEKETGGTRGDSADDTGTDSTDTDGNTDSTDSDSDSTGTDSSGGDSDSSVPAPSPGVLVLAGGGSEGEQDDPSAWSWRAYAALLEGGDVNGDGQIRVLVLSAAEETDWIPTYFQILGADSSDNMNLGSRADADSQLTCSRIAASDAVFLKGGDQGEYYDLWHNTCTEQAIRDLHARGGGVGGTSAGAMSQSLYALAGGMDYVSLDVLQDSRTGYLDDLDGGSGVHDDFLGLLPFTTVDTHFSQRLRLGRMAGTMARIVDDHAPPALVGIGLEEETAIVVRYEDGRPVATVVGRGSVTFLQPGTGLLREPGEPLRWYAMPMDRLTDGWRFLLPHTAQDGSILHGQVDTSAVPPGAEPVSPASPQPPGEGEWYVDGDLPAHEERFAAVIGMHPDVWSVRSGTDLPVLPDSLGVLDAWGSRAFTAEDSLCRTLYELPGSVGFLVAENTSLTRLSAAQGAPPDAILAVDNPASATDPAAALIIDSSAVSWRSLSPEASVSAVSGLDTLRSAGLVGLRLSILYSGRSSDTGNGEAWFMSTREAGTLP